MSRRTTSQILSRDDEYGLADNAEDRIALVTQRWAKASLQHVSGAGRVTSSEHGGINADVFVPQSSDAGGTSASVLKLATQRGRPEDLVASRARGASAWEEFSQLLLRSLKSFVREVMSLRIRLANSVLLGLLMSAFFYQVDDDVLAIKDRFAVLFFVVTGQILAPALTIVLICVCSRGVGAGAGGGGGGRRAIPAIALTLAAALVRYTRPIALSSDGTRSVHARTGQPRLQRLVVLHRQGRERSAVSARAGHDFFRDSVLYGGP